MDPERPQEALKVHATCSLSTLKAFLGDNIHDSHHGATAALRSTTEYIKPKQHRAVPHRHQLLFSVTVFRRGEMGRARQLWEPEGKLNYGMVIVTYA